MSYFFKQKLLLLWLSNLHNKWVTLIHVALLWAKLMSKKVHNFYCRTFISKILHVHFWTCSFGQITPQNLKGHFPVCVFAKPFGNHNIKRILLKKVQHQKMWPFPVITFVLSFWLTKPYQLDPTCFPQAGVTLLMLHFFEQNFN